MKKRGLVVFFLFIFLACSLVSAASIDIEIQKLVSYAQDYESGNIDYVQFVIYSSYVRQKMNEVLGATNQEMGGVLKQEEIRKVLGEPIEETRWVWVENEDREKKMDEEVPAWHKIIYDGKEIQIFIGSWPNLFKKKTGEEILVYRLNVDVQFKKPEEQLDIRGKISDIQELAMSYNLNPTSENAELLAKESVLAERMFEPYLRQKGDKCEETMKSVFGFENQVPSQKLLVQEISFYEEEDFEAILRLEMCEECEWNWISMNSWVESRGFGDKRSGETEKVSMSQYKDYSDSQFEQAIRSEIENYKQELENGELKQNMKLQVINNAWNEKANNVWQEVDDMMRGQAESMQQGQSSQDDWMQFENLKKEKEKEIRQANYEKRKSFYEGLFSSYEKKEFYYTQIEFEKRLVEEFIEFGQEICNNNIDDNKDEKTDCSDDQCAGKICGAGEVSVSDGNSSRTEIKDYYCIQGICQVGEEIVQIQEAICGNHVCEGNESESCLEDCSSCMVYEAVECNGRVIFSGEDENGCPLEPICIEENQTCSSNEDCNQPLCGVAECVEGGCKTVQISGCEEAQCNSGQEKRQNCQGGEEVISEICDEGVWRETGASCSVILGSGEGGEGGEAGQEIEERIVSEPEVSHECYVRDDCGGENDVCSNGECVTIPQREESQEVSGGHGDDDQADERRGNDDSGDDDSGEEMQEERIGDDDSGESSSFPPASEDSGGGDSSSSESSDDGEVETTAFRLLRSVTGYAIQLLQDDSSSEPSDSGESSGDDSSSSESGDRGEDYDSGEVSDENNAVIDIEGDEESYSGEEINNYEQDNNNQEYNNNYDEERHEDNYDNEYKDDKKEDNFQEQEAQMMEKGVFKVGGMCRTSQSKTEGFIYFGGWGDPFKGIEEIKNQYYTGGQDDWCKQEYENLIKQRAEFEKGFNDEFVKWIFEKYLANSAEDWEAHVSGIYELYWKDVELSRRIAELGKCVGNNELPSNNLISVKYESEFGSLEFWEEIKTAELPGTKDERLLISPYMKIWIFPPKEFIVLEMKKAMETGEFPGKPEDKIERDKQDGLTDEEREIIKQDEGFMKKIRKATEDYNGEVSAVVRFIDYDTNEVVFNVYAKINEEDIFIAKPMLPEQVPKEDVRIELDFADLYDLIYMEEKEMQGTRLERPPWDSNKGDVKESFNNVKNGVKMYFKVRSMISDAKVTPESSESEAKSLMKAFVFKMGDLDEDKPECEGEECDEMKQDYMESMLEDEGSIGTGNAILSSKKVLTGEVILE
ncbi:MAG: hypothetical protein ABIH72_02355 [archaeon]